MSIGYKQLASFKLCFNLLVPSIALFQQTKVNYYSFKLYLIKFTYRKKKGIAKGLLVGDISICIETGPSL